MLFISSTSLFFLLVITLLSANQLHAYAADLATALRGRDSSTPGRDLVASSKKTDLAKRYTKIITTKEVNLIYAEGENSDYELNFVASVYAKSEDPVLLLEDFEHLAADIVCRPGSITIKFDLGVVCESTKAALIGLEDGGLVISSHYGCNDRGERRVLRVVEVKVSADDSEVTLQTEPASWAQSFTSLQVQMYHTEETHRFRPHEELRGRQAATAVSSIEYTSTLNVPVPTATTDATKNTLDLSHALIGHDFFPANSSFQVTCKNCSTFGSLDFEFANFELDLGVRDGFILGDIFTGGEATIVANGMGAIVDLTTKISGIDIKLNVFEVPFLFAIKIPLIGTAGLMYVPALTANSSMNGSIGFEYGFELLIPDGSQIFVDLTDPTNSSVSGFDETSLTALPFQYSVDVNAALINFGLRHQVQIGFILDAVAGAEVGIYLDLPNLALDIAQVSNVDENCTALVGALSKEQEIAQKALTDAYRLSPEVQWAAGFEGDAYALLVEDSFDIQILNGTITTLGKSCLNFDKTTHTYVLASEVVENAVKKNETAKVKNGANGQLSISQGMCWVALIGGLFSFIP
ncbi:hypothetical protein BU16DRAFT_559016 [Lophium mytilinum]|uniref:GPI anchored protein n=1 Tax=Lophium mytilinum TaxID=390894 RepID=A0A6A6R3U3_9PEZI|nr:hypothetical protein BU16DRAFT_559016 [Lophium mytilinum]